MIILQTPLFLLFFSAKWIGSFGNILSLLTVFGFWIFPLSATLWQKAKREPLTTPLLTHCQQYPSSHQLSPLQPRVALLIGILVGFLYCALLPIKYGLYSSLQELININSISVFGVHASFSWVSQLCAAVLAGYACVRLPVIHSLFSASLTAAIGIYWEFFILARLPEESVLMISIFSMNIGFLIALVAGWTSSQVGSYMRRKHLCKLPTPSTEFSAGLEDARLNLLNWGAVLLIWLWVFIYRRYRLLLICLLLVALNIAITIWGMSHQLHQVVTWFVPMCIFSLVIPWFTPLYGLSTFAAIQGKNLLMADTILWTGSFSALAFLILCGMPFVMNLMGNPAVLWADESNVGDRSTHVLKQQRRWIRWGFITMILGLALMSVVPLLLWQNENEQVFKPGNLILPIHYN